MTVPGVELLTSEVLSPQDRLELRALWDAAFDGSFAAEDEDHAYGGVHAVLRHGPSVLAHASVVPRDLVVGEETLRAGYVEAVASLPTRQRRGLGTQVMDALGRLIRQQFELGALSTSAHGFYERLGWERWRGPTYVLRDGARIRTEDEDDGLMVLRTQRTAELDLHLPIACHDRPGDAW